MSIACIYLFQFCGSISDSNHGVNIIGRQQMTIAKIFDVNYTSVSSLRSPTHGIILRSTRGGERKQMSANEGCTNIILVDSKMIRTLKY